MATKIVNNLFSSHTVPFERIEAGSFFLDSDGDLCFRTGLIEDPDNAFYFGGGYFIDMKPEEKVVPVNVTINIDSYGK